jgi:WD40 repeat protein
MKAPAIKLELEWCHGYRTRDSRNNIQILTDNCIAYHAAGVGIVYDPTTHTQRFFKEHDDDITAIAYSPDRRVIATGEIGAKPKICVWDGVTMQPILTIKSKLSKGIQALSFSPSGKTLGAVAVNDDHDVGIFSIKTENSSFATLGIEKGDKAAILDIALKDDTNFSTSGVKHFKVWTVGATLTSKNGVFGDADPRHGVCRYMGDQCLSGSITGELYVWTGNAIKQRIKLHDKPIDSIHVTTSYVFTGGKDFKVSVL